MNTRRKRKRKKKNSLQRVLIAGLVILACLLLGISGYNLYKEFRSPSSEELIKTGFQQMEEEQYQEAVKSFETAIAVETEKSEEEQAVIGEERIPYVSEAYRGLGMAYYELESYEQVSTNLQKVIELGGEPTPILYNLLGISAMKLEEYDSALEAFQAGIALPSKETYSDAEGKEQSVDYAAVIQEMKFNRIGCLEKKLDWETAKAEMEAYAAEYPDDAEAQKEAEFLSTR